jgi:hypothetical protein
MSPAAFSALASELHEAVGILDACNTAIREGMPRDELKIFRENAVKDIRRGVRALDGIARKHGTSSRRRGAKR